MNIIKQFLNLMQGVGLKGYPEGARSVCCNEFVTTEWTTTGNRVGAKIYRCNNCYCQTKLR